jgi:exodeoxyribonuclease VII small subunit
VGKVTHSLEFGKHLPYITSVQTIDELREMAAENKSPIEKMSFEVAMTELETIVRELESGKTGLEDSIAAYERGVALKNHCQKRLSEAQMRISEISIDPNGKVTAKASKSSE